MKTRELIAYCGLAVALFFLVDTCNQNAKLYDEAVAYHNYVEDTVKYYKDKEGELVAYNEALKISESTLLEMNENLAEDLKKAKIKNVESVTRVVTHTLIDSVFIPFDSIVSCDSLNSSFRAFDQYYVLAGRVNPFGVHVDSLWLPNKQVIVTGEKKNGFLKPKSYVVTIKNDNPYVSTHAIGNYTITPKKPWYAKWYWKVGIGFAAGVYLAK